MLKKLKGLSTQRLGWLLLLISALILELTALYFQHGMALQPCVLCIYERVALFGVLIAGAVGLIAPQFLITRLIAIAVGLASAIKGLLIALKHVDYQMNPAPWKQCSVFADFPETLPLDKWFPFMFKPTGTCNEITWQFLGLTMAQWIVVIFAFYIALLLFVLLSQLTRTHKQRRLFH
ncbi:disulfide bond formation protein DsbB [Volucribacter amazonae]|uniref:Disulfide bond formation protein B n=1 Tax=Volucribacter amazonae TaxID=256731 RepID=A0A9X4SIG9_9PAST|nr:disulfide bond formation protein DsbB [Volucribacter amazonae]MDG6895620.1 disulfide bond formation protein B [Volucribacter amazonae]